ncbi:MULTISPECIES: ABC transporter permease [unclassified Streptomyces]|uniref:ABC transporter permease n=1 Tax=unclassified Streptomyces TaxID=2593676 RepID=UPI002481EA28|nr:MULTISPECIES: ABC transporter permease [unclassified Streptomyces]MDA5283960.1 ABC transporter permease [Streptomyces sp. Isolate_45]MDX2392885.1 ABC transporter permease [Streptomyces sp. DK15]
MGFDGPVRNRAWEGLRGYGLIVTMWIRSTMTYRTSFFLATFGNAAITLLDFAAIAIMFSHVDALGGFTLPEIALLYGSCSASLGLADLLLGNTDRIGSRIRDGSLDTMLVRPVPVLAQVAADRFALRRLGRIVQGLGVLTWAVSALDVDWTVGKVLLVPVMILAGAGIFGAVMVAGAAFQFAAGDAAEVQNSFTYGGCTMLQYPPTVFAKDLLRGVTFIVPLAFVNWLPALYVLGRPDPLGLPQWAAFVSPLVAFLVFLPASLAWRAGVRSYRSTGS